MKKIVTIVKRIVISGFLLYGYNLIAVNFNMILPINFITLFSVSFFVTPALIALVLFRILVL